MNKRIMCYGDSNTWGYIAGSECERYSDGIRWTSVLQKELGEGFTVLEEGYNGRTTVWYDPIELRPSGFETLIPCLESCSPLDIVTVMLGTNDTKSYFSGNAANIALAAATLVRTVMSCPYGPEYGTAPKVLLIAPPVIKDPDIKGMFDDESVAVSQQFSAEFHKQAEETGCYFLDAALFCEPDPRDGVHITEESHSKLGRAVAEKIREML